MNTLYVSCQISLKALGNDHSPEGAVFRRWLPDGQKDAITVFKSNREIVRVWFRRFGFHDGNQIKFDIKRTDLTTDLISTNKSLLHSGPLFGLIQLSNVEPEALEALARHDHDNVKVVSLGKRVVDLAIHIGRFMGILRTNYGQYWIRDFELFDAREESLPVYCQSLYMSWTTDGTVWSDFKPGTPKEQQIETRTIMWGFADGITSDDWAELGKAALTYTPSLAATFLAQAQRSLDGGHLRVAIIDAVTAAEIALEEFLKRKRGDDAEVTIAFQPALNIKFEAQLVLVAKLLDIPDEEVKGALKAVRTRHEIVHEGFTPTQGSRPDLANLLRLTGRLLLGPICRFPIVNYQKNPIRMVLTIGPPTPI